MCALINNLPLSLSPLLFYHVKLICMFFFFLLFFFSFIGYTIIYRIILKQHIRKLEERGSGSNENLTTFRFSLHSQLFRSLKVINWKVWEQALWITLICVMIRNLWLTMANHYIFFKKCLNCNNSYDICPCVLCVKIECLLSLFQKKNRRENLKMSLQHYYTNK